jgi:hypothetical protein
MGDVAMIRAHHAPWLDLTGLLHGPHPVAGGILVLDELFDLGFDQPQTPAGPTPDLLMQHVPLDAPSPEVQLGLTLTPQPEVEIAPLGLHDHGSGFDQPGWRVHGVLDHDPGDWLLF